MKRQNDSKIPEQFSYLLWLSIISFVDFLVVNCLPQNICKTVYGD